MSNHLGFILHYNVTVYACGDPGVLCVLTILFYCTDEVSDSLVYRGFQGQTYTQLHRCPDVFTCTDI